MNHPRYQRGFHYIQFGLGAVFVIIGLYQYLNIQLPESGWIIYPPLSAVKTRELFATFYTKKLLLVFVMVSALVYSIINIIIYHLSKISRMTIICALIIGSGFVGLLLFDNLWFGTYFNVLGDSEIAKQSMLDSKLKGNIVWLFGNTVCAGFALLTVCGLLGFFYSLKRHSIPLNTLQFNSSLILLSASFFLGIGLWQYFSFPDDTMGWVIYPPTPINPESYPGYPHYIKRILLIFLIAGSSIFLIIGFLVRKYEIDNTTSSSSILMITIGLIGVLVCNGFLLGVPLLSEIYIDRIRPEDFLQSQSDLFLNTILIFGNSFCIGFAFLTILGVVTFLFGFKSKLSASNK